MTTAGKLDQGRESFRQQAWAGTYALLSSADQVRRLVGEASAKCRPQFRELELEELGQTLPRLVEHVVARLSDSGAMTGKFMSKAVRALGAQASVPSEVPEPEDVGPDDPASAAVQAFIAQRTRAPRRADLTYRRDPDGVSDSVHRMRVAAQLLRSGLRVFRSLLDREWADELRDELTCAGSGLGEARELEVLIARLDTRIAALPPIAAKRARYAGEAVLHAADASGLRRPPAGSRRCGPKSAAASGADG
jgi:inorganic triphosphatase YgiF